MKGVYHHCTNQAHGGTEDPEEAAHLGHVHRYCSQCRTGDHSNCSLRCSHKKRLRLAESVPRDDERIEVRDARVRDSIAKS